MEKFVSVTNPKVIENLKLQISNSRIIDWATDFNKDAGISYNRLSYILDYWQNKFSWEQSERELNSFNQFYFIDKGTKTHFLHLKSPEENALPLLLIHGWPGSIFEFFDLVPLLINPNKHNLSGSQPFDLIIPSLPNVGFSFSKKQKPMDLIEIAEHFVKLMNCLGYKNYFIQGGDLGSFIASIMSNKDPDSIRGIHLNMLPLPRSLDKSPENKAEEMYYLKLKKFILYETGYQQLQGTKPFTLAHALNASPVSLCAYISEKFYTWTDHDGDLFSKISIDKLLANITLYWITGCIGASFWPYYARHRSDWPISKKEPIKTPMGYSEFPKELFSPPISLASQFYKNIKHWSSYNSGGHFAAMEKPITLAKDINKFAKEIL